jgi:MATE family multidrug resistance protein
VIQSAAASPDGHAEAALISTNFLSELRYTARLGGPLALAELGWMSTYVVDAIMVGRMQNSALAISGSSLGNSIFYAIVFFAVGLLLGLDALVSQAFGQGDLRDGNRSLAQSVLIAAAATPFVMGLTLLSPFVLARVGVEAAVVQETAAYLRPLVWSTFPLLLYMAVRRYLQAINRTILIMVSLLTANLLNLAGDWALIYGHLGFRPLGIAGSGWATVVVRIYMLAVLLLGLMLSVRSNRVGFAWADFLPDRVRLRALLRLGWPAGVQSLGELGASTLLTILAGRLGATLIAANQVVLDLNATAYMAPLGLSAATAVRVGQAMGRGDAARVKRATLAGVTLSCGWMLLAAIVFLVIPQHLARVYTTDPAVVRATIAIFFICAVTQLFDGLQVALSGALRGAGDTWSPMIATLKWTWLLAMPAGAFFCFWLHLNLIGLWIGRAAGGIAIACTLTAVYLRFQRKVAGLGAST